MYKLNTYRIYVFALFFSIAALLRYVDFFQLEEFPVDPQQGLIELDISPELSQLDFGDESGGNWSSVVAKPLWKYTSILNQRIVFDASLKHRWILSRGQIYRSNPLVNLPQIYSRQGEIEWENS